jgi:hypothetical protein
VRAKEEHDDHAVRHGHDEHLDRFHLVIDVIDRVPGLGERRVAAPGNARQPTALPRVDARGRGSS